MLMSPLERYGRMTKSGKESTATSVTKKKATRNQIGTAPPVWLYQRR